MENTSTYQFDRIRYVQISKKSGIAAALTALHHDTDQWEVDVFEGVQGYQHEKWKNLEKIRDFARELWEAASLQEST